MNVCLWMDQLRNYYVFSLIITLIIIMASHYLSYYHYLHILGVLICAFVFIVTQIYFVWIKDNIFIFGLYCI